MSHKFTGVSVAVMGVLFAGVAGAVEVGPAPGVAFSPKTLHAGGLEIMPWLGLTAGQNDNVGLSNGAKTSSSFTLLNPNVSVAVPVHGQLYGLKYAGNFARFANSSVDNYDDQDVSLFADNAWSSRLDSTLKVGYQKGHDSRNALLFANKETWHTTDVNAMVHYGSEGAQGQFELAAGQMVKRYDSNVSGSTANYNMDRTDMSGTFFYRIAPATNMLFEVGNAKFAYVEAASKPLDSTEQRYMLGAKWDATAKTSGSIKVGTMKKSFSLGLHPAANSTVWDANVNWTPKSYSVVNVALSQKAGEFAGVGSHIVAQDVNLRWTHDWTGHLASELLMGEGQDTFIGAVRLDKRQNYGLKFSYGFRSWLRMSMGHQYTKRNSTNATYSYTQGVTSLVLEGSF